jgi:hypothetical protein
MAVALILIFAIIVASFILLLAALITGIVYNFKRTDSIKPSKNLVSAILLFLFFCLCFIIVYYLFFEPNKFGASI